MHKSKFSLYSSSAILFLFCLSVVGIPAAHAEVFTTTLGETFETPDANLSVDIKANRSEARRGEKITYTLIVANASHEKTITTDLSLIFYNLDLNVSSIQPKQFTGRMSNLTGYPWNFFFKVFQLKPQEKKTLTFTATVNAKAKTKERLRMAAAIQEGEFRNTELIQVDTVYVTASDGPVRSEQKVQTKDIPALFKSVYERVPNEAEKKYWIGRMKDKPTTDALKGAMAFQKAQGKSPKVLGAKSNDAFRLEITDDRTEAVPGELVTVKLNIRNILHSDQISLTTDASAEARNLDVYDISDGGKIRRYPGEAKGGTIDWSSKEFLYNVPRTFTFKVKVPDKSFGDQFCTKGTVYASHGFSLLVLTGEDCTTISTKKVTTTPAVATIKSADVSKLFKQVYGRNPNSKELAYWNKRGVEKKTSTALKGAMSFQKTKGSTGIGSFKN